LTPETRTALAQYRAAKRPVVLATRLSDGAQALILDDHTDAAVHPALTVAAQDALAHDHSHAVEVEGAKWFLHAFLPPLRIAVVGAVHIAQALVPLAAQLGYAVTVIDPRRAFATEERMPGVTLNGEWPDEAMAALAPDARTAVVTLTHDPKLDDPAIMRVLRSDAFYIGCLGSRGTHAKRAERLATSGFAPEEIARIHAPLGLDIGAKSPAEIALSALGQITERLRRPETRPPMRPDAQTGGDRPARAMAEA
jgi:xanthine dehydrogenase accessory factor